MLRPLLLALFVVSAGCLGAAVDPEAVTNASAGPAPSLVSASMEWTHVGGPMPFSIGEPVELPEAVDVLFVDFEVELTGVSPTFQLFAVDPEGDEHSVAFVGGPIVAQGSKRTAWSIVEAMPGTWSFKGLSDSATRGTLNVTAAAKRALDARPDGLGSDRVVVAIVDTGVNPYHEVFQRDALTGGQLPARVVDVESGAPPLLVPLGREADLMATLRVDAGVWASVPSRTLVHFEGTNVLGYALDELELPRIPVFDRAGHGTAVSHAVTHEDPDVLLVMITGSDYDAGVRWAASQPWIDLISLSWGPSANALGPVFDQLGFFVTPEATREAYDAGKVVFGASGNDPTPTFTDTTSGPIWVHAVSGSLADQGARATMSGNFVDTVANWTQDLAAANSLNATRFTSGTSFATPTTAGVAARILSELRQRAAHEGGIQEGALVRAGDLVVTNGDLRDALNATALYWGTGGFKPGPDAVPIAPAPWVSMGWGHVDGSIVPGAVEMLLGEGTPPAKDAAAGQWMAAHAATREALWS